MSAGESKHFRSRTMAKSLKLALFLILSTGLALVCYETHRSPEGVRGGLSIGPAVAEGARIIIEKGPFSLPLDDVAAFIVQDLRNRRISRILVLDVANQDHEMTECSIGLTLALTRGLAAYPDLSVWTAAPPPVTREEDSDETDVEAVLALGTSMGAEAVCVGTVHDDWGFLRFELEVFEVNSSVPIITVGMPLDVGEEEALTCL